MAPLDLVILGPPGAGKGTQAKRIVAETGIAHVGTGDMLRAAIEAGKPLGREVQPVYERGGLVSDELMIRLARARFLLEDAAAGAILDGFPRTRHQAEALDRLLEELGRELALVLELELPEEVAIERMLARAVDEGRRDDTPAVMRRRLELYHRETEPLTDYYHAKGILREIPAAGTEDEVFSEVRSALDGIPVLG